MLRTRKLIQAIAICERQNIPSTAIEQKQGWFYIPEKGQKFPSSMENRKMRPFEEQAHCRAKHYNSAIKGGKHEERR